MKYADFNTTTYAKFIVAGEHAVLRGYSALAMPVKSLQLRLNYIASSTPIQAYCEDEHIQTQPALQLLFWKVLETGLNKLGYTIADIQGEFYLSSNLPVGVNLGASAALCVAIARWFVAQQLISADQIANFARELEDLFHGQSSGIDIAVVCEEQPIVFNKSNTPMVKTLTPCWQPQWYLSASGQVSVTAYCVQQVQQLHEKTPELARSIDQDMHTSTQWAIQALHLPKAQGLPLLIKSMHKAAHCFEQWSLVCSSLDKHMQWLRAQGACAVKPTGAGGGGYVLSLWDHRPHDKMQSILLR